MLFRGREIEGDNLLEVETPILLFQARETSFEPTSIRSFIAAFLFFLEHVRGVMRNEDVCHDSGMANVQYLYSIHAHPWRKWLVVIDSVPVCSPLASMNTIRAEPLRG